MLWIYNKLFPKKYYILILREITLRCIVYPLAAENWFVD
ncbi:DNA-binding protein [Bacillus wiedmannii]|uniref:DNA-binding protein n=1 Tax=Bacillus wiedmannii TaxID=1890302 RepID=A0A2C5QRM3_9BACI|nr:DNA-binding protein [Bacillus sp. BPN334]PEM55088.1 DNA-binding protein [Bacillus wiedmannii]PEN02883.1 DNA-binding protein [Bacillus wiedmannii]PGA02233.1 DNA-binding protein [Bacillus wiedmannii]PGA98224.1 DNA-binding protein [Bacillus wiedmannii]